MYLIYILLHPSLYPPFNSHPLKIGGKTLTSVFLANIKVHPYTFWIKSFSILPTKMRWIASLTHQHTHVLCITSGLVLTNPKFTELDVNTFKLWTTFLPAADDSLSPLQLHLSCPHLLCLVIPEVTVLVRATINHLGTVFELNPDGSVSVWCSALFNLTSGSQIQLSWAPRPPWWRPLWSKVPVQRNSWSTGFTVNWVMS